MFRAHGGIVEARRNRMGRGDLAVFVMQNVSVSSLQDAGPRSGKTLMRGKPSRVFTEFAAAASGFDADHLHIRVTEKIVKKTDGIRPSANACKEMRGQSLFGGKDLLARFAANHRLKIANHRGIGMCTENGAKQVVRASHIGDPVAHG